MIRYFSTLTLLAFFSSSLQAAIIKVHFVNADKTPLAGVSVKVVIANPLPGKVGEITTVQNGSLPTSGSTNSTSAGGPPQMVGQQNGILVGAQGGMGSGGPEDFSPDLKKVFKSDKNGEVVLGALLPGSYKLVAEKKGYGSIAARGFEMTKKDQDITVTMYSTAIMDRFNKLQKEGNDALTQQNFSVAVDRYQEMLKIMPDEPVIYSNLAKAYAVQNNWDKAIPAAQKAAELDSVQFGKFSKTIQSLELYSKAQQLVNQRDFSKAIDTLKQAVILDDANPEFYYVLAVAYGQQQNYIDGGKYIEQALKIRPDDEVYLNYQKILKNNAAKK